MTRIEPFLNFGDKPSNFPKEAISSFCEVFKINLKKVRNQKLPKT